MGCEMSGATFQSKRRTSYLVLRTCVALLPGMLSPVATWGMTVYLLCGAFRPAEQVLTYSGYYQEMEEILTKQTTQLVQNRESIIRARFQATNH